MVERLQPHLQLPLLRLSLQRPVARDGVHRKPRHRPFPCRRTGHARPQAGTRPATDHKPHTAALLRHRGAHERHETGYRRQCASRLPGRIPRRHAERLHEGRTHQGAAADVPMAQQTATLETGQQTRHGGQTDAVHTRRRSIRSSAHPQRQSHSHRPQRHVTSEENAPRTLRRNNKQYDGSHQHPHGQKD